MKKMLSLMLGLALLASMSLAVSAETVSSPSKDSSQTFAVMPRKSYDEAYRTIYAGNTWTSKGYYCVAGDYFGGGTEDLDTLYARIQYSSSGSGSWQTLASKNINGSGMGIQVTKAGYYRLLLTNKNSYAVTAQTYVQIN